MPLTDYLVLISTDDGATWAQIGTDRVQAASADTAIRTVAEQREASGIYVAVPARSWQPRTVGVETKPKVTFS